MMGKLQKKLVEYLISLPPKEKREIGNRIVRALGGDCTPQVTGLSLRRGVGDGGLDGRIPIRIRERIIRQKVKIQPNGSNSYIDTIKEKDKWVEVEASFNIKIEKNCFARDTLNAFVEDSRRENIFAGVIVTAVGLCPDAQDELHRHNSNDMDLCHIALEDLLSGDIRCSNISFVVGDLAEKMASSLKEFLNSQK